MLMALAAGETDPALLADLAKGQLRKKLAALEQALSGRVQPHHRVLIRAILRQVRSLEQSIEEVDREIEQMLAPFEQEFQLLQGIPGVNRTAAATIIAEIGVEMDRFPSAQHLASWAGVCPGNKQSGGKRLSGRTTQGNPWLRGLLGEVAWAAIRQKNTSFGARFRRLARRQNKQKAMVAVMPHLLMVIYHVLRTHEPYQELGPEYFQPTDPQRLVHRHIMQLEQLGYQVTLVPKGAA